MYKKIARLTLFVILILSGVFAISLTQLKFDYDFEAFFPNEDPDLAFFLTYRDAFENDNDYLLIGIRNEEGIFEQAFLQKLEAVTNAIDSLELVRNVSSITNLPEPVITPLGLLQPKALHIDEPKRYAKDSALLMKNPLVADALLSSQAPATNIIVNHRLRISKQGADSLMTQVNHILDRHSFDEVRMAGKAYAQGAYIEKMKTELMIFVSISVILVTLFLIISFRTSWGVLVPLAVVILTVVWVIGLMPLLGKKLDIMMVLLPTIMFVVGMSDVVHILTKYIEELRNGANKIRAIQKTFKEVGMATLLTSITTAIGFLTLLTASIPPIRQFGIFTALGVFVAFLLAFSLLPAIMVLMKRPKIAEEQRNRLLWVGTLSRTFLWILRHRLKIAFFALAVIGFSLYGISKIEINTFLLEDIQEDDPLKQDFNFFDENFGGSKPFEMALIVKDSSKTVFSPEVLKISNKVQAYLENTYETGNLISPVTAAKAFNKALNGANPAYFHLPDNARSWNQFQQLISRMLRSKERLPIVSEDGMLGRFSGRTADWGSKVSEQKNEALARFLAENVDPELVEFRLTGTALLLEKNANSLIKNMLEGLGIAFGIVALIAALLFRSVRMILVTLIPNILPLLIIAGIMGYFGIYLKLSTSIIFTIAFGIAVDDTIHFISKLRIELAKGKNLSLALKNTFLYTGKAIILTTIILAGGFMTLVFSSFGGTFYTGLLVSLTLILAVVADLMLLPVLLLWMPPGSYKAGNKQNLKQEEAIAG